MISETPLLTAEPRPLLEAVPPESDIFYQDALQIMEDGIFIPQTLEDCCQRLPLLTEWDTQAAQILGTRVEAANLIRKGIAPLFYEITATILSEENKGELKIEPTLEGLCAYFQNSSHPEEDRSYLLGIAHSLMLPYAESLVRRLHLSPRETMIAVAMLTEDVMVHLESYVSETKARSTMEVWIFYLSGIHDLLVGARTNAWLVAQHRWRFLMDPQFLAQTSLVVMQPDDQGEYRGLLFDGKSIRGSTPLPEIMTVFK